jgi:hypothetical protein
VTWWRALCTTVHHGVIGVDQIEVAMMATRDAVRPSASLLAGVDTVHDAVDVMLTWLRGHRGWEVERISSTVVEMVEKRSEAGDSEPGWSDPVETGISRWRWQRYRKGTTKCNPAVVRALAVVCGVSKADWLALNGLLSDKPVDETSTRVSTAGARARVLKLSATALREVAVRRGPDTAPLSALYVERTAERVILDELLSGASGSVLGEAGTGKTSLLWSLARGLALAGREPILLRAEDLVGGRPRLTTDVLRSALGAVGRKRPVLLLDSVDLLLRDERGREVLDEVVAVAIERNVPTALSCRGTDVSALGDGWDTLSLRTWTLRDYNGVELRSAIAALSTAYYRGHAELDHEQVVETVLRAVVDGLPIKEVCERPLTLHMLFEVAGDDGPEVEIDVDELMGLYWERRVRLDDRLGAAPDEPATRSAQDRGTAAEAIAGIMLAEGRPEAERRLVTKWAAGDDAEIAEQVVQTLRARGVLLRGHRAVPVKFFHQALFEYAGGRRLRRVAEDGVGALLDLLERHPDDAYRIAVAEQALVQAGRAAEVACAKHLTRLLGHAEHSLQSLGLRVHARLPNPPEEVREQADQALRECSVPLAIRYLDALPATRHAVVDGRSPRLARELRLLWERGQGDVRRVLASVLLRLAVQVPVTVLEFLEATCADHARCAETPCASTDCLWSLLSTVPWERMREHGTPAVHLLETLAPTAPGKVWPRLRDLTTRAAAAERSAIVARCLRLVGKHPDFDQAAVRELVGEVEALRSGGGAGAGDRDSIDVEHATAVLLARHWQASGIAGVRNLIDVVTADTSCAAPEEAERVTYLAVAECAKSLADRQVVELLDAVVAKVAGSRSHLLAAVLLRPLLVSGGPGGPVALWAAAALRAFTDVRADARAMVGAVFVRTAIDDETVPDAMVAALFRTTWPRRLVSMTGEGFWLDPKRVCALTVQATAGGHPQASGHLRQRRAARASSGRPSDKVDLMLDRRCRRVGKADFRFLDGLFTAGLSIEDVRWLAQMVDNDLYVNGATDGSNGDSKSVDPRALAVLEEHADHLSEVAAAAFAKPGDRDLHSAALRLSTFLVRNRVGPPPAAAILVDRLRDAAAPQLVAGLLKLLQAVLDRSDSVPWTYDEGRSLDEVVRQVRETARTATTEESLTKQGRELAEKWRAIERDCRRCGIALDARLSRLDTAVRRGEAVLRMRERIAEVSDVDDLVRVRGLIESLAAVDPAAAVDLFVAVVERTDGQSAQGYDSHAVSRLGFRWWRLIDRVVASAPHAVWDDLLERLRDGPWELFQVLLKVSSRIRPEDVGADLMRHAKASRHRHRAESAVEQHLRVHRRQLGVDVRWHDLYRMPVVPHLAELDVR